MAHVMMGSLQGKNALITGGGRGIGRAISVALAEAGVGLAINYLSNDMAAAECEQLALAAGGPRVHRLRGDVAQEPRQILERALDVLGTVDILVHCAYSVIPDLVLRASDDGWQRQLSVNTTGPLLLSRAFAERVSPTGGAIVFIGSVMGEAGQIGAGAYASTKSASAGAMRSLARELGPRQIRVNVVSPSFTETDLAAGYPDSIRRVMLDRVPLGRFAQAPEVARCVRWIVSDAASFITGQLIRVNGGRYL